MKKRTWKRYRTSRIMTEYCPVFPTYQIHPQRPGGAGPVHSGHGWVKSFSWRKRNLSRHRFLQQTHHQRIQTVIVCRSKILVL